MSYICNTRYSRKCKISGNSCENYYWKNIV